MRILVDARLLDGGGIGRYLREVLERWLRDERVDSLHLLGPEPRLRQWLAGRDGRGIARVTHWDDPPYSPLAQLRWPLRFAGLAARADVAFFPHFDVPLVRHPRRSVVTVHDLNPFRVPGAYPPLKRRAGARLLTGALERASRVMTVSRYSAEDLMRWHPDVASKITVVPNGVSDAFRPLEDSERPRAELHWGPHRPYLLLVGSCRPLKNPGLAVRLVRRLRVRHPGLSLLIAGPADEHSEAVMRDARLQRLSDVVMHVGPQDDDALRGLICLAELLLFPSFHEGFGLPPLEAMACGTPVIASDRTSIPEVVADAAPLVSPDDEDRWEAEAHRILEDREWRNARIAAGLSRAGEFDWNRTAAAALEQVFLAARRG